MNNLFIEGPIQTGKSTLIREVLKKYYGPLLDGRTDIAGGKGVGGFTVQRMAFPTQGTDKRFGFRLMEASAPIASRTCVVATDEALLMSDGVFKVVGSAGGRTNMKVFETKAVDLMSRAMKDAASGRVSMILLDEIGGHELACPRFCKKLYQILDSDAACIGVIKYPDSARRMDPAIAEANIRLHKKITGPKGEHGEILYYERGMDAVRTALEQFVARHI